MGTFLSIGYTFMRQSFNFQKLTGTLKIKTFFWKFAEFRFFLGILDIFCDLVRPCANWKKQTNKCKILDLGSQNSLLQHDMCPTLFSKITPPYCASAWGQPPQNVRDYYDLDPEEISCALCIWYKAANKIGFISRKRLC